MQVNHDYAQHHFGWLVPTTKKLLTTPEVGAYLRRSADYVRDLVDEGGLESHQDSATGNRLSNRITTRSVVIHLARTATYTNADMGNEIAEVAKTLPAEERKSCVCRLIPGFSRADLRDIATAINTHLLKNT